MALYSFECKEHGIIDIWQGMTESHEMMCGVCGKPMRRIFYAPQLKCGKANLGHDRATLFDNLASEGFAQKEWRETDTLYKQYHGIED